MAEPSAHRRCLLQVSRSLERQDIDEMLYLSEDFVPQTEVGLINSGIDLMRCLEKYGWLGPGDYHYLACCLREIGRIDLVQKLELCSSGDQPLSVHSHCFQWNKKAIEAKRKKLLQTKGELRELSQNRTFWDTWMGDTLQKLSTQLGKSVPGPQPLVKAHSSCSTNKALKAVGKLISGVLQNHGPLITNVEQQFYSSPRENTGLLDLETLKEDLSAALSFSPVHSTVPTTQVELLARLKEQHPLSQVADKVLSCYSDLLKELCGEVEAEKQLKDFEDSLLAIRTLLHINAHLCFGFLSLVHLTDIVAASRTEILDQEATYGIALLVDQFQYGMVLSIQKPTLETLKDTSVLDALKEDEKMQHLFATGPPIPCACKANKILRFGVFTVLLTLYKSANLTQCEWKKIRSQITLQVQMNLSEPNYDPFLEIDVMVMNSLEGLLKHFSLHLTPP